MDMIKRLEAGVSIKDLESQAFNGLDLNGTGTYKTMAMDTRRIQMLAWLNMLPMMGCGKVLPAKQPIDSAEVRFYYDKGRYMALFAYTASHYVISLEPDTLLFLINGKEEL